MRRTEQKNAERRSAEVLTVEAATKLAKDHPDMAGTMLVSQQEVMKKAKAALDASDLLTRKLLDGYGEILAKIQMGPKDDPALTIARIGMIAREFRASKRGMQ